MTEQDAPADVDGVFNRFGVRVTVVEALDRLPLREEPEAGALLQEVFEAEGLEVRVGARATEVRQDGNEIVVSLDNGADVRGERLLVATGRQTSVDGLGLDTVGVAVSSPFIEVDDHLHAYPTFHRGVEDALGQL